MYTIFRKKIFSLFDQSCGDSESPVVGSVGHFAGKSEICFFCGRAGHAKIAKTRKRAVLGPSCAQKNVILKN